MKGERGKEKQQGEEERKSNREMGEKRRWGDRYHYNNNNKRIYKAPWFQVILFKGCYK